jgi:hypothetical protein
MVDEKFVINLQGKKFITFEGLLQEFHSQGGNNIETKIISTEPFIIHSTAKGSKGCFTGIGDASDDNVGNMVKKHKIRMAETRAVARSLRLYCNIGMCSMEELGDEAKEEPKVNEMKVEVPPVCNNCAAKVGEDVKKYSMKFFDGHVYCRTCQTIIKEQDKNEQEENEDD